MKIELILAASVMLCFVQPSPTQAQASEVTTQFNEEFGMTERDFDRRLRRLRSVGWCFFGLSSVVLATVPLFHNVGNLPGFAAPFYWGLSAAGYLTISGALLLRARAMVIRRRRFRERQAALDRSYFHPELDIGITPGGLSLHLSF